MAYIDAISCIGIVKNTITSLFLIFSLVVPISLAGCSTLPTWDTKTIPKIPEDSDASGRHLYGEHSVVFYLDNDNTPRVTEKTYRRDQVYDDRSSYLQNISSMYDTSFCHLDALYGRITLPSGKQISPETSQLVDAPYFADFVLYSDSRIAAYPTANLPAGGVIEELTQETCKNPEYFIYRHFFDDVIDTDNAILTIKAPASWQIEIHRIKNTYLTEERIKLTDDDWQVDQNGEKIYTVRIQNRSALPLSSNGPHPYWWGERIEVRLASWIDQQGQEYIQPKDDQALSKMVHGLMEPVFPKINDDIKNIARSALEKYPNTDADSLKKRAAYLYGWVRDEIRYCAIEVGLGGFIPHAAKDAEEYRYGDCKDKANLLRALLDEAGIPSKMALIYSHEGIPRDFAMPVLAGNFNHAILRIDLPSGPVFVDPTARTPPFGRLPYNDEGAHILAVTPDGTQLVRSDISSADVNQRKYQVNLSIDGDNRLSGSINATYMGVFADHYRSTLLAYPEGKHTSLFADAVEIMREHQVSHAAWHGVTPTEFETPLSATGSIFLPEPLSVEKSVEKSVEQVGTRKILFHLSDVIHENILGNANPSKDRPVPFFWPYLFQYTDTIVVDLGTKKRLSTSADMNTTTPVREIFQGGGLTYTLERRVEMVGNAQKLIFTRTIHVEKIRVDAGAEWQALRRAVMQARAAESRAVLIEF